MTSPEQTLPYFFLFINMDSLCPHRQQPRKGRCWWKAITTSRLWATTAWLCWPAGTAPGTCGAELPAWCTWKNTRKLWKTWKKWSKGMAVTAQKHRLGITAARASCCCAWLRRRQQCSITCKPCSWTSPWPWAPSPTALAGNL